MLFWLHCVLGYFLSTNVATFIVFMLLFLIEPTRTSLSFEAYGSALMITIVTGLLGYTYIMYSNRKVVEVHFGYWLTAGMKNVIFANFIFIILTIVFLPILGLGLFILVLLPITLAGGAAGGYVYGVFRKRFPYQ